MVDDFSYLRVGDRIHVKYLSILMRNLLVTSVDKNCLVVENMYPFERKTGKTCDNASDHMYLIRRDVM